MRDSVGGYYCEKCKAEVVVARSGRRMMKKHPGMPILCLPCGLKEIPDASDVQAAPGALEELVSDWIQDAVERRTRHTRN